MSEKKRLFVGIRVVPDERTEVFYSSIGDILNEADIKWVGLENLHLTLKFLGDVGVSKISGLESKLKLTAKKHQEFTSVLKGVGIFKNFYHPKVLWMGLRDCPGFDPLKNDIENSLSGLGFETDYRKFTPHLTIGRFKHPGNIEELTKFINGNQDLYFQAVPVRELILFESILRTEVPEYKEIFKVELGKEEDFSEYRF